LGVPPWVSNDSLFILFLGFLFKSFILRRKWGFLHRSMNPSDTLVSVFFLVDRAEYFPLGRGFSSDLLDLLHSFGVPALINCDDKGLLARALHEEHIKELTLCWDRMSRAKSMSFFFLVRLIFLMLHRLPLPIICLL
jgi:hypothetical protein